MKKSKKAAASKPKKTKKTVKELSQTHGKVESPGTQPSTLDQVWGDEGLSVYETMDEEVYSTQLNDYNRSDLQSHAGKLGIVPIDDRDRLTKNLIAAFRVHVANYKKPADGTSSAPQLTKEVLKILGEGR